MAVHRLKHSWDHTAALLTIISNALRDGKSAKQYAEYDFNPYRDRSEYNEQRASWDVLKVLVENGRQQQSNQGRSSVR